MTKVLFLVQGSAGDPYEVTFEKTDEGPKSYCTCPAGEMGQLCKHRKKIISGKDDSIVSGNQNQVTLVSQWYGDSPAATIEAAISLKEKEIEKLTKEVQLLKKQLAKAL